MPTYEYRCDVCGEQFEIFQRITDEPEDACPHCGGGIRRLIGATNFILKGSGWYKTDYTPSASVNGKDEAGGCSVEKDRPQCKDCPANTE